MSKLIEKAKNEENKNNFEVSLSYYEMSLSDPSCPFDIRSDMGGVYNKLRNFDEALKCFDTVLDMDKNHLNSLIGKGISCLGLNRWDDALELFLKVKEIEKNNANIYYFISIILQCKNDNGAQDYYSKFLELDNAEFERIRSYYNFGVKFLSAELKLSNNNKEINIKCFEDKLNDFDLNDDEIDFYLNTLPYDDLISKINELNDEYYIENEKSIIRSQYLEMGFNDEDIDDYFIIDTIDTLKEDIISRTNVNPFPDKNTINIPLYVADENSYIFERLCIKENATKNELLETLYEKRLKLIIEECSKDNFDVALWFYNFIDESIISNEFLKVNFRYMRNLIVCNLEKDWEQVSEDFVLLEKDFPEIVEDYNYKHNKKIIKNNLEKNNCEEMIE